MPREHIPRLLHTVGQWGELETVAERLGAFFPARTPFYAAGWFQPKVDTLYCQVMQS